MKPPNGLRLDPNPIHQLIPNGDGTYRMGPAVSGMPEIAFQMTSWPEAARLGRGEQGLILSGSIGRDADGRPVSLAPPTAQELRHYCLLWDRLDYPSHDDAEELADPDLAFLTSEGILVRTLFSYMATPPMRERMLADGGLIAGPAQAFQEAEERQPGQWALARPEDGATFSTDAMVWGRGLLFELHNAIPVPAAEVPLHDVLEFKQQRGAELMALRQELGATYQLILQAPDAAHAYRQHLDRLDKALASAVKVSRESKFPIQFSSFQAKLDYKVWTAGAVAFAAASQAGLGGLNSVLSGLGMAALSSLNVTAGVRAAASKGTPFEYVTRFHDEVFR